MKIGVHLLALALGRDHVRIEDVLDGTTRTIIS
jgi:hypothetical protein